MVSVNNYSTMLSTGTDLSMSLTQIGNKIIQKGPNGNVIGLFTQESGNSNYSNYYSSLNGNRYLVSGQVVAIRRSSPSPTGTYLQMDWALNK